MPLKKLLIWLRNMLKKILTFLLVGAALAGLVFFLRSNFWEVKRISCEPPCSAEFWAELMNLTGGKNLLFLPIRTLANQIMKNNPLLKTVKIKKNLPGELIFELEKRTPEAAVTSPTVGEEKLVVDSEGILLAKTKNSELPLILIKEPISLNIGEKLVQEEIIQAVKILVNLKLYLFQPQTAKIISVRIVEVQLKNGPIAVFSTQKDFNFQLDSLQLILSRAKIEGKKVKRVDLRFEKPVAIYD